MRSCATCSCTSLSGTLKCCSGCRKVWYCGAECAKAGWLAGHKKECALLRSKKNAGTNEGGDSGTQGGGGGGGGGGEAEVEKPGPRKRTALAKWLQTLQPPSLGVDPVALPSLANNLPPHSPNFPRRSGGRIRVLFATDDSFPQVKAACQQKGWKCYAGKSGASQFCEEGFSSGDLVLVTGGTFQTHQWGFDDITCGADNASVEIIGHSKTQFPPWMIYNFIYLNEREMIILWLFISFISFLC